MLSLVAPLAAFFKKKDICIYDRVFKLHSKVTVSILLAFTIFLGASQYFGTPIDCFVSNGYKPSIDNFCWITGTFTSKTKYYLGKPGRDIVSYGIAATAPIPMEDRNYQKFYQWVSLVLLLQAITFYFPAYFWKVAEGNVLNRLVGDLHQHLLKENCSEASISQVTQYIMLKDYCMSHNVYAIRYLIAEIMNFCVVLANMVLVNYFLADFWMDFFPAIYILLEFDYETWSAHSAKFFPRLAKCEFFSVGPSGSMQMLDGLCLLPLNILNEKLYAFLYLWFFALFCVSALNLVYKVALLVCRPLRFLLLRISFRGIPSVKWYDVLNGGEYGQWFLFYRLGRNLSINVLKELVDIVYTTERDEYYLK